MTGDDNTANGVNALSVNTTGSHNTADGVDALLNNTTGDSNTANGWQALASNTTGRHNTANGINALFSNTTGLGNTATGGVALRSNTTGSFNTAVGEEVLLYSTGNYTIALGALAGFDVGNANNVIAIGAGGANISNTCFIGNIYGVEPQNAAIPVYVSASGQLGTSSSSRRFKKEIKPLDNASEAILALKPVTFQYKSDNTNTPQFGLIAEEVAEVNPDLVVREKDGEIYTVRYDAVNAMLLNEFLKEHRKVEQQEATITQLKKDFGAAIAQLTARLDEQAAQIQKVSAQFEASKATPQVVKNP